MHPLDQLFAQVDEKKRSPANDPCCPSRGPAFHETIIITVPFGPSVLKNDIFSMMIGKFSVFSAFLCAMLYMSFYHMC